MRLLSDVKKPSPKPRRYHSRQENEQLLRDKTHTRRPSQDTATWSMLSMFPTWRKEMSCPETRSLRAITCEGCDAVSPRKTVNPQITASIFKCIFGVYSGCFFFLLYLQIIFVPLFRFHTRVKYVRQTKVAKSFSKFVVPARTAELDVICHAVELIMRSRMSCGDDKTRLELAVEFSMSEAVTKDPMSGAPRICTPLQICTCYLCRTKRDTPNLHILRNKETQCFSRL